MSPLEPRKSGWWVNVRAVLSTISELISDIQLLGVVLLSLMAVVAAVYWLIDKVGGG